MGTIIWLVFTTFIGWAIGYFWITEHVVLCSIIGFIIGLILRFFARIGTDSIDVVGDIID